MAEGDGQKGGGLRALDGVALVVVGVVGFIVAFAVLHAIAGFIWGLVKFVIVIGVVGAVLWYLLGRRR